jgi:CheY-like chemotaxis protein
MPKLLVVDASPMMHRIMELTFAPEGIQVISASDGDQAIALLPLARPDVVIADHAVSGTSGYDVAAFLKNHDQLAGVPVLLLASPFEPIDRARAEAAGVAAEISKPFEPAQLVARVRALLDRKRPAPPPDVISPGEERPSGLKLVESAPPSRGALDDYFDRLDAALMRLDDQLGSRNTPDAQPADQGRRRDEALGLPTIAKLLGEPPVSRGAVLIEHPLRGAYAPSEPSTPESNQADAVANVASIPEKGHDLSALVDALEALRRRTPDPQRQETPAPPVPAVAAGNVSAPEQTLTVNEAVLDEITRRVLERLAPGAINDVVIDVVTRVAERLLREEIARLK